MDANRLKDFTDRAKKNDPMRAEIWAELQAILTDAPFTVDGTRISANQKPNSAAPAKPGAVPPTPPARTYTQAEVDAMKTAMQADFKTKLDAAKSGAPNA